MDGITLRAGGWSLKVSCACDKPDQRLVQYINVAQKSASRDAKLCCEIHFLKVIMRKSTTPVKAYNTCANANTPLGLTFPTQNITQLNKTHNWDKHDQRLVRV